MNGQEILNEILKSPKLKKLIGVPEDQDLHENLGKSSEYTEIAVIQDIINAEKLHTSDDNLFKTVGKLFDV